jgi:hypothetical protein
MRECARRESEEPRFIKSNTESEVPVIRPLPRIEIEEPSLEACLTDKADPNAIMSSKLNEDPTRVMPYIETELPKRDMLRMLNEEPIANMSRMLMQLPSCI